MAARTPIRNSAARGIGSTSKATIDETKSGFSIPGNSTFPYTPIR